MKQRSNGLLGMIALAGASLFAVGAHAGHLDWRAHEEYGKPPSPCARSSESAACHKWLRDQHRRHGPHHHHYFHGDAKG
ncbi:MAG: hypothetical protein N2444_09905 [Methylocystis sp.]|nr:hypothetical protein [Methylocystis sp.]